ncbi:carbohydrate ABC transporter permease [Paenibacillus sp. LHD-38]|uniref:carbohydrate ABC transporter permease n=1 Tax=Paenibacillus sp. LHD-38 TaxID=3072143 RepID=UPI00280E1553|nr:carbohydrate ABC transporter permease [Paenibacillus sp. LHD-38]MDQ8734779.1 carbohydrate ABC transporter permease [Paenibacillus sp. LHD-38]
MNQIRKDNVWQIIIAGLLKYSLILIVLFISVYPVLWVFISSFKEVPGGLGLPEEWIFNGYITIFTKLNIASYFSNSIMVSVLSTIVSVTFVSMAAYVSARIQFKGKPLITLMFASTLFIPPISISFPIYRLINSMGLYDTRTGLVLIYSGLGIAVTFFVIRNYFLTIPKEMEEVALIDGCSHVVTFFRVILPLAKPGIATAAVLSLLNNWNEFYFAALLLESKDHMTIPALLGQFRTAYARDFNGMFSAIIVSVVPTILLFSFTSNLFIKSLTAGAVKG